MARSAWARIPRENIRPSTGLCNLPSSSFCIDDDAFLSALYKGISCSPAAQADRPSACVKSQLQGSHVSSNPIAFPFCSSLLRRDQVSIRPPNRFDASRRRMLSMLSASFSLSAHGNSTSQQFRRPRSLCRRALMLAYRLDRLACIFLKRFAGLISIQPCSRLPS